MKAQSLRAQVAELRREIRELTAELEALRKPFNVVVNIPEGEWGDVEVAELVRLLDKRYGGSGS